MFGKDVLDLLGVGVRPHTDLDARTAEGLDAIQRDVRLLEISDTIRQDVLHFAPSAQV